MWFVMQSAPIIQRLRRYLQSNNGGLLVLYKTLRCDMAIECVAITLILCLFVVSFAHRGHKTWALATLPLIVVPFTNAVLQFVVIKIMKVKVTAFGGILTLLIAVAVSAAWIGASAGMLKKKRVGGTYMGISNAFNIALAAILINSILKKAGELKSFLT